MCTNGRVGLIVRKHAHRLFHLHKKLRKIPNVYHSMSIQSHWKLNAISASIFAEYFALCQLLASCRCDPRSWRQFSKINRWQLVKKNMGATRYPKTFAARKPALELELCSCSPGAPGSCNAVKCPGLLTKSSVATRAGIFFAIMVKLLEWFKLRFLRFSKNISTKCKVGPRWAVPC